MAVVSAPGYTDLVEIGRGGNAIVFSAVMEDLGRKVALKVLVQLDLDGHQLRRFETEARSMGQLAWHPNIVQVFGVGRTELGQPFIAMELLERPLSQRLKQEGPLSPSESITVGVQIANALQAAHEINVVHRDIKPANILLTRHGDVKLADFGIATLEGSTTVTGSMAGTVGYMAPEVIRGERATPLTDIYSLGATLFALTTGTPAFVRSTDETPYAALNRVLENPPPDPRSHGVPDRLASVLERAMARHPKDRYASAGEMEAALRMLSEGIDPADMPSAPAGPPPVRPELPVVLTEPQPVLSEPLSSEVTTVADTLSSARNATTVVRNPVGSSTGSRRSRLWFAAAVAGVVMASGATALALSDGTSKPSRPTTTTTTSTTGAPTTTTTAPPTTALATIPVTQTVPAPQPIPTPAPLPSPGTSAKPRSAPVTKKPTQPSAAQPTPAPPTQAPPTPAPPTQAPPTQPPAPTGPSTTLRPPPR